MTETTNPTQLRDAAQEDPLLAAALRADAALPAVQDPGPSQEYAQQQAEQAEVYRTEVQIVTHRAMLLEAKAREMQGYFKMAKAFAQTKMVRKEYQWNGVVDEDAANYDMSPIHNLCAAMMYGAKLGIEPEDAGLLVITINDQPGLEAKTMVGIVRKFIDKRIAEGRTKIFSEGGDGIWEVEGDDQHCVWAARRDGHEVSVEWTMERAINADLTNDTHRGQARQGGTFKDMYGKFPIEMLRARAQSEVSRMQFSDVLRGMQYSAEELRLIERTKQVRVDAPTPGGKGAAALEAKLAAHEGRPENHPPQHQATYTGRGGSTVVDGEAADWSPAQPQEPDQPTTPPAPGEAATEDVAQRPNPPSEPPAQQDTLTALHTLLTESGVTERARKLTVVGHIAHKPLSTTKELTEDQAHNVIATLRGWERDGVMVERLAALGAVPAQDPSPADDTPPDRATMQQLSDLRSVYKRLLGLSGQPMLEHIADTLGWTVDNLNDLTDVDVRECVKKVMAQANAQRASAEQGK